ncbi:hypothetical protein CALVIDRAFT_568581 [Calocera viscosa TUFC12733]|uniref:Zn(2)-C6 fungal-type domain-containing protein n=1 Tax=Calocera viscosa (strain TUFC12733) TaxID=1330018 RepID=A0A167GXJ4_CALVF|nr:hypothetical protein CALVIDRAFT_568581 [Calocera viscosa TUFC12733]
MSQQYRPSSSHSHPLPIRPAGQPGHPSGMPSPPLTGYAYARPPSHGGPPPQRAPQGGTVLPGIDELIRGMPRDQVPPGPSVQGQHPHQHQHQHPHPHQQEPDYSRIPGPPSPPWPNPPRRPNAPDSPAYAYSQAGAPPRTAPQSQSAQGGMYTPPNSGGSRPPTGTQPPQGMQQTMAHIVPHGGHIPAGTSPLPFPSVTYASPIPPSPNGSPGAPPPGVQVLPNGIPLDGPYYLTSHPYTTIYFAPPNQFGPARNARACKKCRQRKVRCSAAGGLGFAPGEPGMKCERCERAGEECVFEERQVSRRRPQGSTGSGGSGRASGSSGRSATADDDYEDDEESISTPTATTSTLRTPASSVASPPARGSTKAQGPPPAPSSGAAQRGQAPSAEQQQAYYRTQSMPPK